MDIDTRRKKQQALMTELLERKIRLHAQHLYDQRGQAEGLALQDWVEAESQVLENSILAPLYRKTRLERRSPDEKLEDSENAQFAQTDSRASEAGATNQPFPAGCLTYYLFATAVFPLLVLLPFLSSRSSTAATINGSPTVASTNTSPNLPPSAGGTNLPHDTASL